MKTQNRPLTQEELEMAWSLDWKPTHYWIDKCGGLWFENNERYHCITNRGDVLTGNADTVAECASPIPQKPFDIHSLEWSYNSGILHISVTGDNAGIVTNYTGIGDIYDTKQDIINKAKALGITAEDLK